jgi:protein-S-isoprenylcysteine O-methyltransferase Ste14
MCRAEERDLMLRFGQAYGDYMQRVGFFGPKR